LSLTINHSDGTYEAGLNRKEFDQRYPHFLEILSQSAQEVLGDVPAIKGLKFSPQSIVLLHDSASPDYLPLSEWRFESDFGPDKSGKFPEPVLDSEQTLRGSPLQLWLSDPREKLSRRDDPFEERIELKAASFEILMNGGFQVATPQFVDGLALAARLGWVCQKPTYVGPLIRGVSVIDGKLVDSWDAPDDATRYVITLSLSEFELPAFYCAEYGTVSSTSLFALEHKGAINGDDIEIMQMCRLESSQRVEVDQIPEISREELHTYLTDRMQREYRQMGMGNFRLGGVSRVVYDLSDIRKLAEEHRLYMPVGGMSDLGIEPKW
jgi:hypothetical protein